MGRGGRIRNRDEILCVKNVVELMAKRNHVAAEPAMVPAFLNLIETRVGESYRLWP
jgi:hypothetical protein